MNTIITLLIFASTVVIAIWLFRYVSQRMATKGRSRAVRWSAASGVAFVVFIAGLVLIPTPDTPAAPSAKSQQQAPDQIADQKPRAPKDHSPKPAPVADSTPVPPAPDKPAPADEQHLPITIDVLESRINQQVSKISGQPLVRLELMSATTKQGRDVLSGPINDNAAIVAGRERDGDHVKYMMLTVSGDGARRGNLNALIAVYAVIATLPGMDMKAAQEVFSPILSKALKDGSASTVKNSVQYQVNVSNVTGVILTISPAKSDAQT